MKSEGHIVVIGAGIWGASAGYFLASWGNNVTIIEKEHPASGPTGRSSAVLHAFYVTPELSMLAGRGMEILRQIPELTGAASVYHSVGTLWACGKEKTESFLNAIKMIQEQGFTIEPRSGDELKSMAPDFNWDGVDMAVWEPTAGYADPYDAANAMVKGARDRGAQVRLNTSVKRLNVESGRVTGVTTVDGEVIPADIVLVATGIWTKPILADVGCDLPLTMERHPHLIMEAPGIAKQIMPFAWVDDVQENYGRPDGENRIILGANHLAMEDNDEYGGMDQLFKADDPDNYNAGIETDEAIAILQTFLPRIPKLENLGIRPGYSCLYDMTPEMDPIIDAVPGVEGLFTACGSSGHGFKTGPAIGQAAARMALGEKEDILAPFCISRFST